MAFAEGVYLLDGFQFVGEEEVGELIGACGEAYPYFNVAYEVLGDLTLCTVKFLETAVTELYGVAVGFGDSDLLACFESVHGANLPSKARWRQADTGLVY